jgi:hypothetical protein
LETIKVYENKPADIIQGQMDTDYLSRVCLSFILPTHYFPMDFGSFRNSIKVAIVKLVNF